MSRVNSHKGLKLPSRRWSPLDLPPSTPLPVLAPFSLPPSPANSGERVSMHATTYYWNVSVSANKFQTRSLGPPQRRRRRRLRIIAHKGPNELLLIISHDPGPLARDKEFALLAVPFFSLPPFFSLIANETKLAFILAQIHWRCFSCCRRNSI